MGPVSDTLIIKNFPPRLSKEEKKQFLVKCGATKVKILPFKFRNYNVAFARFPSSNDAEKALHHLHQQQVFESYLVVEYARDKQMEQSDEVCNVKTSFQQLKETGTEALIERFLDKLNNWTGGADFRSPVPSHLRYHYPPPTPSVLANICTQLSAVPKFYTQVLHLMNKMNLPCPFVTDSVAPPRLFALVEKGDPKETEASPLRETESESEISSDDAQVKEKVPTLTKSLFEKKKIKRPTLGRVIIASGSQCQKKTRKIQFEDVFENISSPEKTTSSKRQKVIDEPLVTPIAKIGSIESTNYGFGFMLAPSKPVPPLVIEDAPSRNEMEEERLEKETIDCITAEALASNRISVKDHTVLPVYKNYAEGAPNCRLYVKNLAKQTTEFDLKFIYSRFLTEDTQDTPRNMFDIRLMQEGRMKGQAFITLQSVDLAKKALSETNGYILNDKPMVVQFARSSSK